MARQIVQIIASTPNTVVYWYVMKINYWWKTIVLHVSSWSASSLANPSHLGYYHTCPEPTYSLPRQAASCQRTTLYYITTGYKLVPRGL